MEGEGKDGGRRRWLGLGPVWRWREGSASAEVLTVEMTGFPDRLNVSCEKKSRTTKGFEMSNWKLLLTEMGF